MKERATVSLNGQHARRSFRRGARRRIGRTVRLLCYALGVALGALVVVSLSAHAAEPALKLGGGTEFNLTTLGGTPAGLALSAAALRVPDPFGGEPAWRRSAVPTSVAPGQAAIAIVIDDMGYSAAQLEAVLALDGALTLSFLPDGDDAPALARRARAAGREILVHVPMEANDPGRRLTGYGLRVGHDGAAIRRHLGEGLGRFEGYVGINNHMGSRFTRDLVSMLPVLTDLKRRGLIFLDSKTTLGSQGAPLATALGLPHAVRDVFLDSDVAPGAIARELERLERLARERGLAIAIGHSHRETLAALRTWLPAARARGIAFVPISYAANLTCGC
jgi:polysaccharide deacetylase 2 family uncharacterized protein YibQ